MATDDLSTPLGQDKKPARWLRYRLPISPSQAIAAALGLFIFAFASFALLGDNPLGGEPTARVAIDPKILPPQGTPSAQTAAPAADGAAPKSGTAPVQPGQRTITIIDGSSGQRQDVVVATPPPSGQGGVDSSLFESSRYGNIPAISASGMKPSQAYARPVPGGTAKLASMPAVSIVVTGLGIGTAKTSDAIAKLPGAVTLGFMPYGADLESTVAKARNDGHEIVLQVPMEPFDYPDNDPGPQTLLTSLAADQNIDRLHWHMSRFTGYVGLANFMGARFQTSDSALQPVFKEIGKRGLVYLDDGSAPRSLAGEVAEGQALPLAKADLIIDSVPALGEIDRALARLESLARQRGIAIGIASTLPVSLERISAWAKTLESRGIALVPLTAAMRKAKSS